ncbi:hypothetical protein J8Z24_21580 (plasmid) [Pseudoalteromonas sp. SCSIO 43201]|uniref:T4 family baseplate hub assembly chaperone n=1 Tax=Pseudoalteromonas TaxID=53246 RepID=UPI0020760772|nr:MULTISPECIES: hypothetical protein [Pseudoalteromonas]MDW7551287.1 hypothetical protein [Pseudoalteromonas peptidolytica]USD31103.1 hypothetical protein J8Z24_21580 [Pseudoalteromonas sp. SCSIO 43201]
MNELQQAPDRESNLPDTMVKVAQLPSRGLAYPVGTEIHYKPYTFGEVKMFSQAQGTMSSAKSTEKILNGISVEGMDREDITFFDFLYIALLRRLSTMNAVEFNLNVECPQCQHSVQHQFGWENLQFEDLAAPKLPVIADLCGMTDVKFKPLTVGQYLELTRRNADEDPVAIAAMQSSLDYKLAYNLFNNAIGDDAATLEDIDKFLYHDLKPMAVTCANTECGIVFSASLDDEAALINPFRKSEPTTGSRVRFGN